MKEPLIMKFGGAALKSPAHLKGVAKTIVERRGDDSKIVVVVSAMGAMTDELLALARQIAPSPPKREQDMLLSVGERISMALLAMALKMRGESAISFTGSQSGIITCNRHTEARIQTVRPKRIIEELERGKIVIVAGFQGMSDEKEITTLGRGGSDTSAVALAVALGASRVEFYKDVPGVYSEDPQKNRDAKFFPSLSYRQALELGERGDFVLHPRSIRLAAKNGIAMHVMSFKEEERKKGIGTLISKEGASLQELQGDEIFH